VVQLGVHRGDGLVYDPDPRSVVNAGDEAAYSGAPLVLGWPEADPLNPAQSSAFRDLRCVLHKETPWFMLEV
jgi:hypothetical protein